METKPKTDEEINAMAHAYRGSGATADELFAHKVGFRQAESELLPKLQKAEERVKELEKANGSLMAEYKSQFPLEERIKELEVQKELDRHRHEAMMAELSAMPVIMIDVSVVRMPDADKDQFIHKPFVDGIIEKYK